jgi:7-carboxy-7-deazaguanine synthase
MDIKAPDSGEAERNFWANLERLNARDELKLVLSSSADYDWAVAQLRERRLERICPVLFSPVQGRLDPAQLAEWVLRDRLPVRFQLQLHKVLWGNSQGR